MRVNSEILVVIPCFNEEATIKQTIENIRLQIPTAYIVVIDNASDDSTAEVAKSISGVQVLTETQKGKGFAIRHAFSSLKIDDYDVILMTDGDDTYSMESFSIAYELVKNSGVDMVIGNRIIENNGDQSRHSPYRKFHALGNSLISRLNKLLFRYQIEDTLSGWRVMSPGFVISFWGGASGFEIESELNAHCFILKSPPRSVNVMYRGRILESKSKLNTWSDGFKIVRRQLALFKSERPFFAYGVASLPIFFVSVYLIKNVISSYLKIQLVPNFPSLIAGIGGFTLATLLCITGLILENVRLIRVQATRYKYSDVKKRHQP